MNEVVDLDKLRELRDEGKISEEEFVEQERRLVGKSLKEAGERLNQIGRASCRERVSSPV